MGRMMTGIASFSAVLKLGLGDLVDQDADGFLSMMAEDAVMEFPYALPGQVRRLSGRAELAAHLSRLGEVLAIDRFSPPRVHRTQDPEVTILEFTARGRGLTTAEPYDQIYISVITAKHGKIVHYRDYWNPLAVSRALGGGDAMSAGTASAAA